MASFPPSAGVGMGSNATVPPMIDRSRWDLHLPAEGTARAAAVVLHPHPGMGGDRHHPVVVAVAEALAGDGLGALRVDIAAPDPAVAVADLVAAAELAQHELGADSVVLIGYSWGSLVTAMAPSDEAVVARVLVAPPVSMHSLDGTPAASDGVPTLVLVPAHDQFGPPDAVRDALGGWAHATVEEVPMADHFLVGHSAAVADRVAAWTAAVVASG
jgi:alpha/beta superfamily hydrolase